MSVKNKIEKLKNTVIKALEDLKGVDIKILPVSHLTTIADYMIICSGTSDRHLHALANNVYDLVKAAGFSAKIEGEASNEWVLLDSGDVIVHVMLPKTRDFYNLEGLWQDDAA